MTPVCSADACDSLTCSYSALVAALSTWAQLVFRESQIRQAIRGMILKSTSYTLNKQLQGRFLLRCTLTMLFLFR